MIRGNISTIVNKSTFQLSQVEERIHPNADKSNLQKAVSQVNIPDYVLSSIINIHKTESRAANKRQQNYGQGG